MQVTAGIATGALDKALHVINDTLQGESVRANVITSGHGDWRRALGRGGASGAGVR